VYSGFPQVEKGMPAKDKIVAGKNRKKKKKMRSKEKGKTHLGEKDPCKQNDTRET